MLGMFKSKSFENSLTSKAPQPDSKLVEIRIDTLKQEDQEMTSCNGFVESQAEFAARWWTDIISLLKDEEKDPLTKDHKLFLYLTLVSNIWNACQDAKYFMKDLSINFNSEIIKKALNEALITFKDDSTHKEILEKHQFTTSLNQDGTVLFEECKKEDYIYYSKSKMLEKLFRHKNINIYEALQLSKNLTEDQATFLDSRYIRNLVGKKIIAAKDARKLSCEFSLEKVNNLTNSVYELIVLKHIDITDALNFSKEQIKFLSFYGIYTLIVNKCLDINTAKNLTIEQASILDQSENYNLIFNFEKLINCKIDLTRLLYEGPNYLISFTDFGKSSVNHAQRDNYINCLLKLQSDLKLAGKDYIIDIKPDIQKDKSDATYETKRPR